MCASGSIVKNLSDDPDEPNALLDAPIMIPERANDSNKSKETRDTTEVESNGCQSSTYRCTCMRQ